MTDYVVSNGRSSTYPPQSFGAQFIGSRATFCTPADFAGLSANVLAIPNLPITVLSASPVTVSPSFFGMHVLNRANDPLTGVSAGTVRSHDCALGIARWCVIETSAGVFGGFANLDAWVNAHYAAGRDIVFTLFGTPAFYSARPTEIGAYGPGAPGCQAEPSDMATWSAYCTAVATRYIGKIKYYEIWNEPNYNNDGAGVTSAGVSSKVFFFSGTWAKLSQMVRLANQAIKAVDANAKIICPPVQGWQATSGLSDTYFNGMMAANDGASGTMAQWVDIAGVHLYPPGANRVQDLSGVIDRVNACKATAGIAALPTWDTESAPFSPFITAMQDDPACRILARMALTMAAKGVARTIYYQYDNASMGFLGRTPVIQFRERLISLMKGGTIQTVSRFTDGRVAIYTDQGLSII